MLILDFSQICIGSIMVNLAKEAKSTDPGLRGMIKHLFLSQVLSYKKKFKDNEIVIACDSRTYWRRDFFPYYKGNRKEGRDASELNWELIHETLAELKNDLRENFLYKVIEVDGAEADDVIAVLTKYHQENDLIKEGLFDDQPKQITIISADTDFVQLQVYPKVQQYSQMQKKMVKPKGSLQDFIIEHVVRGDTGDGIPNILSPDNSIVEHIRQKPIKQSFLDNFTLDILADKIDDSFKRNYIRNRTLVDFNFIPKEIETAIVNEYKGYILKGNRNRILNYLMKNKMKLLLDSVQDF